MRCDIGDKTVAVEQNSRMLFIHIHIYMYKDIHKMYKEQNRISLWKNFSHI